MGVLNTAAAALVGVIADALAHDAWQGFGIVSPEHWVRLRFGLNQTRARRLVAAARALTALPQVRAAFAAGELTEDHVGEIVRARVAPRCDAQVRDLARHATISQLRRALTAVPHDPDPDPGPDPDPDPERKPDPEPEPGPERSGVWTGHGDDGAWWLRARAGTAAGALVDKALTAARTKLFHARYGPDADPTAAAAAITALDALMHLAHIGLDAMDPATATTPGRLPSERYLLNLHLPAGAGPGDCHLHLGPTLTDHTETTCDALWRLWRTTPTGRVDLGRIQRVVDTKLRTVIEHRDHGCRVPGCGNTRGLVIHHIRHWTHGGPTDTHNLLALCPAHHHLTHTGRLTIAGNPDTDTRTFTGPDGSPVGPAPPRPPNTTDPATAAHHAHLPPGHWDNRRGDRADYKWLTWN
jgi:hypothetical protein